MSYTNMLNATYGTKTFKNIKKMV